MKHQDLLCATSLKDTASTLGMRDLARNSSGRPVPRCQGAYDAAEQSTTVIIYPYEPRASEFSGCLSVLTVHQEDMYNYEVPEHVKTIW